MGKKLTKEDFIAKAREVHGDKYDYSKVEYISSETKVCIICPKHGEFEKTPKMHFKGQGCPKCSKEQRRTARSISTEDFIDKAKRIHGDKYDYSKVVYVNTNTKVRIICPKHGEFIQTPGHHLQGSGCPICANPNSNTTTDDFIKRAKLVHGNKYDYSQVNYINARTPVIIICKEHGEFWQTPDTHINRKSGCPKCLGKNKNLDDFITQARSVHGNKYDYSKVVYKGENVKVCIVCPEHGEFWQTPHSHNYNGSGCPICAHPNANMTTDDFIRKAKIIHGEKYDYSKTNYINTETKVCIICPEHGPFLQKPKDHLYGKGCRICGLKNDDKRSTLDEFIEKATEIHGNKYDYSKAEYVNALTKVRIICPKHGEFMQTPASHLHGTGCPKCSFPNKDMTTNEFIKKANETHGDKYDYSKVEYKGISTKVCIICPKHGEFWQTPHAHLNGTKCPKCAREASAEKRRFTLDEFLRRAKNIHGNRYDYSKIEYVDIKTKVRIICPDHGVFMQTPDGHLQGKGCPKCGSEQIWDKRGRITTEEFVIKAREIHGEKYDYSKVEYKTAITKVCITCPEHGIFWQTPNAHLSGHGCPICNKGFSRDYKLSLLQEEDLLHMSSHQLIEIIANKKLPYDFKELVYSPQESEERIGSINHLKELLGDTTKSEEEIDEIIGNEIAEKEKELQANQDIENNEDLLIPFDTTVKTEPDSLPTMLNTLATAYDDIFHMKPSDDAAKFIVLEETHKLWNEILKANEDGILETAIEEIKNKEGGEFWQYIQSRFLNEYNSVIAIEKGADYKFKYEPSLMQKFMVYCMQNNNSFGNWCGTGAGKTNAFLMATRHTNSHVNVAIVPNDVIDTLKKSINAIYPDSEIIVPQSPNDVYPCNPNKFSYIIYNYEKFQTTGVKETIDRLLETNTVDFICLDEVQNVKIRYDETQSKRSQSINDLIIRCREKNPEMKTLAMSATPCINNLREVRSIIELLTGVEYDDIKNINSIANIHNAYKALLINGFRYVPKYPIIIDERTVDVDCTNDTELYDNLINKKSGDIAGIEYVLAKKKLDIVGNEIRKGTIVYATYVDGMCTLLTDYIKSCGYSVESYNGKSGDKDGRKEILDRFLCGKTEVLVCSKPISTGVDGLQEVCNKMVIVSLPWTDADYTQLKGRIYRQGSKFNKVDFVIPQITINTPDVVWSWDKMRKNAIDTKKSLGTAVVDGYIQKSYTINKEQLLAKAIDALKEGLDDITIERQKIESNVVYTETERKYSESFINEIHKRANTSSSNTTHKHFQSNRNELIEYHRQREISKSTWVEDPVDRVAEIIGTWKKHNRIIDLGCGTGKLKTVVDTTKTVQGVDHINVSDDNTVLEADMCNLKEHIEDNCMDVAVYCLSLWGTNYDEYFNEAYRILDYDGRMIVVEPSSKFGEHERYGTTEAFINGIEKHGFDRIGAPEIRNNFIYFKFMKH